MVVRGDLFKSSKEDVHAATLAAKVFRLLIAICAYFDLEIHQFDAVNAFTNADIDELVHCQNPEGFQILGKKLRLNKALYGLTKSPLLWFNDLSNTLKKYGFEQVLEAPCLLINGTLIAFFFVDDIALVYHKNAEVEAAAFKVVLMKAYEMKDLGPMKWFLKVRIERDREARKIWICQDTYIKKMARRFQLDKKECPPTPMGTEHLIKYEGIATPHERLRYQQKVGSLTYATTISRPDIAFASSKLASHMQNPSPQHELAADRVIRYLNGTSTFALEFGGIGEATVLLRYSKGPLMRHLLTM